MHELEFIGPNDRPALLALSTPEWLDAAKNVLTEIGYKVHAASNHNDFVVRFGRIQYQVVLIEELFACNAPEENATLQARTFWVRLSSGSSPTMISFSMSIATVNSAWPKAGSE